MSKTKPDKSGETAKAKGSMYLSHNPQTIRMNKEILLKLTKNKWDARHLRHPKQNPTIRLKENLRSGE